MTAAELKYNFDIKLKALTDIKDIMFESVDINRLMAEAEIEFIRMAYQSFDRTELERKLVGNLVTTYLTGVFMQNAGLMGSSSWAVSMPADMMYVLEESVVIGSVTVMVKPVTYDRYLRDISNPFKNPCSELVWRLDYGGTSGYSGYSGYGQYYHELVTDGSIPSSYRARYIRTPVAIDIDNDVTSEVHPNYHLEIVNGAVKLALEIINLRAQMQQKSQPQPQESANDNSKQ